MARPQLATAGLWCALAAWNGYFWPLLITDSPERRTVQVGLAQLTAGESTTPGVIYAGTLLVLVPTLLLVVVGQRFLVRGSRAGSRPDRPPPIRRNPMRPRLLVALAAVLALGLGGCGAPASTTSVPVPGPAALDGATGPVTVTLWHGLGGAGGDALTALVAEFNAAHAGRIELQAAYQGSYADTLAKYTAALRDGGTPSILVTNDITTGFVRDAGQTIPAQDLAAANPADLDLDGPAPRRPQLLHRRGPAAGRAAGHVDAAALRR